MAASTFVWFLFGQGRTRQKLIINETAIDGLHSGLGKWRISYSKLNRKELIARLKTMLWTKMATYCVLNFGVFEMTRSSVIQLESAIQHVMHTNMRRLPVSWIIRLTVLSNTPVWMFIIECLNAFCILYILNKTVRLDVYIGFVFYQANDDEFGLETCKTSRSSKHCSRSRSRSVERKRKSGKPDSLIMTWCCSHSH